jgi:hypothetical protein
MSEISPLKDSGLVQQLTSKNLGEFAYGNLSSGRHATRSEGRLLL